MYCVSTKSYILSILQDSLLLLVLVPVWGTVYISSAATIQFNSYTDLSTWVSVMMGIRALRPLHIVSLFRSLRAVIREILEGWKNLLIAAVIMFGFMFMVASLGVQVTIYMYMYIVLSNITLILDFLISSCT